MEQLNDENFLVYAMNHYTVPTCLDLEEFNADLKRIRYVSRAFKTNEINVQLILNHIIILHNAFGIAATKMLLFKICREKWSQLIPFLLYLDRLTIDEITHIASEIVIDADIAEELKNL